MKHGIWNCEQCGERFCEFCSDSSEGERFCSAECQEKNMEKELLKRIDDLFTPNGEPKMTNAQLKEDFGDIC